MAIYDAESLMAPETIAACRTVLSKWQAVPSKTKGRTIRLLRGEAPHGTRCLDDVLAEAVVPVQDMGVATPSASLPRAHPQFGSQNGSGQIPEFTNL